MLGMGSRNLRNDATKQAISATMALKMSETTDISIPSPGLIMLNTSSSPSWGGIPGSMRTGDPDQVLHGLRLSIRHVVITKHADCHGNEIWIDLDNLFILYKRYKWDHQSGKS